MTWERITVECVICPKCAFTFAASHVEGEPVCQRCPKPRARKKRETAADCAVAATAVAWRCWRDLYPASRRAYGAYVDAPEDGRTMARVAIHAARLAREQCLVDAEAAEARWQAAGSEPRPPVPPATDAVERRTEHLLRHWFRAYLRNDGSKTFSLADQRHALRYLERDIPVYGTPWGKPQQTRREATSPLTTLDAPRTKNLANAIVVPRDVKAAIASLGRGPSGPPVARRQADADTLVGYGGSMRDGEDD